MMTIEERLKIYREKKHFIYDISMAFIKNPKGHTVDGIVYEVFFKGTEEDPNFSEWLTVQYHGGAEAHRCVTWNSNSANFRDVAEMMEGGCYGENAQYRILIENGWKRLDLTKICGLHEVK
jgi:hypothetical protein